MSDTDKLAKKILIIEDDAHLIEMLNDYFQIFGRYEIFAATSGEEGIRLARELQPHLILQDIRLPDVDGFEVCRRLREGGRLTANIPLIFLTEKQEREDRLVGLQLGAVDYITKPFDMQELRLRVRNVLRRASYESMVNAVTNLPEGTVVREQLDQTLKTNNWGIVLAGLVGLSHFRDQYGFVASDDVSRATGIMLSRTLKAEDHLEAFIGHIDTADFIAFTTADKAGQISNRFAEQLEAAMPQFYPAVEREGQVRTTPKSRQQLNYRITVVTSKDGQFNTLEDLRTYLNQKQPA